MQGSDDEAFLKNLMDETEEEHKRFDAFEDELKRDLESVKHVEENLDVLGKQMESLKRVIKKRDDIYGKLKGLGDPSSEDVDKAESYLHRFDRLQKKVDSLMMRLVKNVDTVHMDEVHELFHEPRDVHAILKQAADKAERMQEELTEFKNRFQREARGLDSLRERLKQAVHA